LFSYNLFSLYFSKRNAAP